MANIAIARGGPIGESISSSPLSYHGSFSNIVESCSNWRNRRRKDMRRSQRKKKYNLNAHSFHTCKEYLQRISRKNTAVHQLLFSTRIHLFRGTGYASPLFITKIYLFVILEHICMSNKSKY